MAVGTLVLLAAPGPFASATHPDTTQLGFADDHVAVLAGGGRFGGSQHGHDFGGWTTTAELEALRNGVFADLRTEYFSLDDHVRFWAAQGGYLAHPKPAVAGGVTLGYRHVGRAGFEDAAELGLPLMVGSRRAWFRFEPTYVVSSRGVSWNYRWRTEIMVARHLSTGFDFSGKPLRQGDPYFGSIAMVVGWRP